MTTFCSIKTCRVKVGRAQWLAKFKYSFTSDSQLNRHRVAALNLPPYVLPELHSSPVVKSKRYRIESKQTPNNHYPTRILQLVFIHSCVIEPNDFLIKYIAKMIFSYLTLYIQVRIHQFLIVFERIPHLMVAFREDV